MTDVNFDWKNYATKLRSVLPEGDDEDLSFLAEELDGVQVVALGEATHGTREIFQMKHRLISYLVRNHGFRLVTFEAGVEPCRHIDAYVRYGRGDLGEALSRQTYWTWDTLEVTQLLEWMRAYNLSCPPGAECGFAGFDMKPIESACDNLRRVVLASSLEGKEKALEVIRDCRDVIWYQEEKQDIPDVYWLNGWFAQARQDLLKQISMPEYELALEDARYISQFVLTQESIQAGKEENWAGSRDYYMARNVKRLLDENPDLKLIVWAHNGHVANDPVYQSMGWHLRRWLGSRYFTIGFSFGTGAFQSRDSKTYELRSFMIEKPFPGTWDEFFFNAFGKQNWFLRTRKGIQETPEFHAWASVKKPSYLIGSMYAYEGEEEEFLKNSAQEITLANDYDGMIFLGQTTRARPNLSGQR